MCLYTLQSQSSARMGDIRLARDQGIVSAYLNVTAIIFALVVAAIAIGVTIGVYGPTYYLQQCIQIGMQTNPVRVPKYSALATLVIA